MADFILRVTHFAAMFPMQRAWLPVSTQLSARAMVKV